MQTNIRLLLASAALLLISALPGFCLPAVQSVTIDLTGQTIQGGHNLLLTATVPIEVAPVYYYSISGTVMGAGRLADIFPSGSLVALFDKVDPGIVPYLSGTLLNARNTLPFTVVNAYKTGRVSVPNANPLLDATYVGSAQIAAGITAAGFPSIIFTKLLFGVRSRIPGIGSFNDTTDAFTFTSGQITISTNPPAGPYQPDLSYYYAGHLYGVGVTGTDYNNESFLANLPAIGQHYSLPVILQNTGTNADSFTLKATKPGPGFTEGFIYNRKNITAAITSNTGFTIPAPVGVTQPTLAPDGVTGLIWVMVNTGARPGIFNLTSAVLTATSNGNPSAVDAVQFEVLAEHF